MNNVDGKYWVFTLNNYTAEEDSNLTSLQVGTQITYLVLGKETGDSGTDHIQGYVELPKRRKFGSVKSMLGERVHLEKRRGTSIQAAEYCKKDGDFVEMGVLSEPPKSKASVLDDVYGALKGGMTITDLSDEYFSAYVRYEKGIRSWLLLHETVRMWEMNVQVLWGNTGTGKTRHVYDSHAPELVYAHPGGSWFDGYNGQEIVLFDDFCGAEFKLSYFLKVLDRYPMKVPIKGGFVNWVPKIIYITSNLDPATWYQCANLEHQRALRRRFTKVTHFTNLVNEE